MKVALNYENRRDKTHHKETVKLFHPKIKANPQRSEKKKRITAERDHWGKKPMSLSTASAKPHTTIKLQMQMVFNY